MMINLDCLPFDVIDYIVNSDCLSYVDLCKLSLVSTFFNCIVKSNKLWKKKYAEMWPELAGLFDVSDTDWHHEFRLRVEVKKLVSQKLSELSANYHYHENISNVAFLCFKDISRSHSLGYNVVIDELENIIHHTESHLKLTQKYYGIRALRYLRHAQLEIRWKQFLSQPPEKMSFLEGACLISQWCQPTALKCLSQVSPCIEDIVKLTLKKIKQLFPDHPVLKQGMLKEDRISSSLWSPLQCKNIIYCINKVFYHDMHFTGNPPDCITMDAALIDQVLKHRNGMSLTLGIIYSAVGAKLGVKCEPYKFSFDYFLVWQERDGVNEKDMYTFIDIMENGALKSYNDVYTEYLDYDADLTWADRISTISVFTKCAWYLVEFGRQSNVSGEDHLGLCNALELICILSPDDMEHKMLLARLFMHLRINTEEAISQLQEISATYPTSPLTLGYLHQSTLQTLEYQRMVIHHPNRKVQRRIETVGMKYAVGMVMRHKKYDFRCVIYAWDNICNASPDWVKSRGVNKLKRKCGQPFYYVLVDGGINRYTAEDNLEINHENKPISHIHIGRYFESFHGSYYMLNQQTIEEYPEDIEARERALEQNKSEVN